MVLPNKFTGKRKVFDAWCLIIDKSSILNISKYTEFLKNSAKHELIGNLLTTCISNIHGIFFNGNGPNYKTCLNKYWEWKKKSCEVGNLNISLGKNLIFNLLYN